MGRTGRLARQRPGQGVGTERLCMAGSRRAGRLAGAGRRESLGDAFTGPGQGAVAGAHQWSLRLQQRSQCLPNARVVAPTFPACVFSPACSGTAAWGAPTTAARNCLASGEAGGGGTGEALQSRYHTCAACTDKRPCRRDHTCAACAAASLSQLNPCLRSRPAASASVHTAAAVFAAVGCCHCGRCCTVTRTPARQPA